MEILGLIAGSGRYPFKVVEGARKAGVGRIVVVGFQGETDPELEKQVDAFTWLRVGQLGKMINWLKGQGAGQAIMAGQIAPGRLFDFRPDFKALFLLARLKKRNAESLFGAIADEMEKAGVGLLPATSYVEEMLAPEGHIVGPSPSRSVWRDVEFGWPIAKKISAMDVGQTIVVKKGTVLAVEGFDGTDATIRRGGELGKGGAVVIKVSKPGQDMRFDVPVIGPRTLESAAAGKVGAIVCEAKKTLLLEREELTRLAREFKISIIGKETQQENYE